MSYSIRFEAKLTKQIPIKDKGVNSPFDGLPLFLFPIAFAASLALNLLLSKKSLQLFHFEEKGYTEILDLL